MENKIQELTDKIYREGVEKGNEEAQKLIVKAQEEAQKIVENAQKEADSIVAAARKSADELAENTKSELTAVEAISPGLNTFKESALFGWSPAR